MGPGVPCSYLTASSLQLIPGAARMSTESAPLRAVTPVALDAVTGRPDPARAGELQQIAARAAGSLDLDATLREVLDGAQALLGADAAAVWLVSGGGQSLRLAAHRGLAAPLAGEVERFGQEGGVLGMDAIGRLQPILIDQVGGQPAIDDLYAELGIGLVVAIPLHAHDELVGLLVVYRKGPAQARPDDVVLFGAFAVQLGAAVAGARLLRSVSDSAARLQAVHDLSWRLNGIADITGIGQAIVAEAHRLVAFDTIRVYRVDGAARMCEPIAFLGRFMGVKHPSPEMLRVAFGRGVTGWVAEHNEAVRLADAAHDQRAVNVGQVRGAESMLVVPMSWEQRVVGLIVLSKLGYDHYGPDDQRLMETFAGYAAQAMVNAENVAELRRQRRELALQLEGQRRLIEINERLLATLDAEGVLDLIADSLAALVSYDSLSIYRVDRKAGVRRAVMARDPNAELILAHRPDMDAGINGWVAKHGEAQLVNDVHLDPRAETVPGTAADDPESMICCPLMVNGVVEGTLSLSRQGGEEAHFSQEEFELVKLFAAQASIALRNADAHGAVRSQAEIDALTGIRSRGSFTRDITERVDRGYPFALVMLDLDFFKRYNDTLGHPAGDALLARVGGSLARTIREGDRAYRYGGDEFAVILNRVDRGTAFDVTVRIVGAIGALTAGDGPEVTASAGIAMFPDDGATREEIVDAADRNLYRDKSGRRR